MRIRIGTAGWGIPRASVTRCPGEGTHLERYARAFNCAEINSSFHRPHAGATYAKWAAATPADFSFAVKVPRVITHDHALEGVERLFGQFIEQTDGLGSRRGPLLVQLPPSSAFREHVTNAFLTLARQRFSGLIVWEPRHPSWFLPDADALLRQHGVARVAADPARAPGAGSPGGWDGLAYFRLHGAPRTYWSAYDADYLAHLAATVEHARANTDVWCVFDNTASGAAVENAWELQQLLHFTRAPS